MSNIAKLKKKATELEQKKQFEKALQLYVQLLDEAGRDLDDADLQLYNRVGDLFMRQGNPTDALNYYEKAVDVYAERGFLNNAIALCSKILRQSPGRTTVYYKLGRISANKGFKSDAKKNFLEYADRMQKAGQRDEAFRALKEFADLCPDQDDIRLMLAEMLSKENRQSEALDQLQTLYEKLEGEGRGAEARATLDRMKAIDPAAKPRSSGTHRAQKPNDLVFLDLSHDLGGRDPSVDLGEVAPVVEAPPRSAAPPDVPALEGLSFTFLPEEASAFEEPEPVEGLEPTRSLTPLDAEAIDALLATPVPTIEAQGEQDEVTPGGPIADLELTQVSAPVDIDIDTATVELAGWEPTAGAPSEHSSSGTEAVLTGEEFAELEIHAIDEARPTPVHDLLLPGELPILATPADTPSLEPPAVRLESPSPIDLTPVDDSDAARGVDLLAELTAPIARAAAPTPREFDRVTDPFGVTASDGVPIATDAAAGESGAPSATSADRTDEPEGHWSGSINASATSDNSPMVAEGRSEDNEVTGREPSYRDDGVATEPENSITDAGVPDELSEEAIEAAFDRTAADPTLAVTAAEPATDVSFIPDPVEDASTLVDSPGFGETDAEASAFEPFPKLDTETLQPDAWEADDAPEVLIDGEWHDEHVGDAVHVDADNLEAVAERFDDLAAAMMWVPTDESSDEPAEDHPVAPEEDAAAVTFDGSRSHLSFGGVEEQLRRRLELVPENWALRRQLGEALLDAGDREAGLYELDLAMVGYELSGDLNGAMDVADGIVRMIPSSVRHHQKRVEYAVRAGDRIRLVEAYMELGDALFRDGQVDKAEVVYSRVLELSPGHERATFALGNLTHLEPLVVSDAPMAPHTPPAGDEAFAEWEPPAHVLESFISSRSGEQQVASASAVHSIARADAEECEPVPETEHSAAPVLPDRGPEGTESADVRPRAIEEADAEITAEPAVADSETAPVVAAGDDLATSEPSAGERLLAVDPLAPTPVAGIYAQQESPPERVDAAGAQPEGEAADEELTDAVVAAESIECAKPDSALDTESLRLDVLRSREAVTPHGPGADSGAAEEPTILKRARSLTPVGGRDDDFVDLGDWLRETEPERTTRLVVEEARPTGDEEADFADLLRRFKRGIAENVAEEDFASHYDLGVAYKEMGLIDEAIAQFQRSLRGESHRVRSYEALGQCFVEKRQFPVAAALLQRAAEAGDVEDHQLVGVLYLLGFSMEAMGRRTDAMRYYQRVFAVDIDFRDVAQRVAAMEHQTT